MRVLTLAFVLLTLAACSRTDEEHARAQARQSALELKHDSEHALHEAEKETDKAGRELKADMRDARAKTDAALQKDRQ